jgi:4-amino-4-deoxy-L-arabinose transferase-like glycosyltransferase
MGTFASMAQNSYGLGIMGGVAFVFGLVFLAEFIFRLRKKNEEGGIYELIEPVCLFVLSVIFGFRVFYIHFPFIELLFAAAAILLAVVYLVKMNFRFRHFQSRNTFLSILLIAYHGSIILFLSSLALMPFAPKSGEAVGAAALILLLGFIVAGVLKKNLLVDGENVSALKMVRRFRDHSVIIVSLFLLFSLYVGFNRVGILPDIYSDEFPRAYFKLVDEASVRKEKARDGKYKYEEFMEKYQLFLKHQNRKNQ